MVMDGAADHHCRWQWPAGFADRFRRAAASIVYGAAATASRMTSGQVLGGPLAGLLQSTVAPPDLAARLDQHASSAAGVAGKQDGVAPTRLAACGGRAERRPRGEGGRRGGANGG
nr:unnamed protein product [Digitaria exilis]